MPSFHIRIDGDDLTFAAAHFITLDNGECERLHGHTYGVAVEIAGPLNDQQFVIDFLVVRKMLQGILAELDHRVLLPTQHPAIRVMSKAGQIEAVFDDRRWTFPEDDCRLLPVANTTTELLAHSIGAQFLAEFSRKDLKTPSRVRVEVREGTGATAICELP